MRTDFFSFFDDIHNGTIDGRATAHGAGSFVIPWFSVNHQIAFRSRLIELWPSFNTADCGFRFLLPFIPLHPALLEGTDALSPRARIDGSPAGVGWGLSSRRSGGFGELLGLLDEVIGAPPLADAEAAGEPERGAPSTDGPIENPWVVQVGSRALRLTSTRRPGALMASLGSRLGVPGTVGPSLIVIPDLERHSAFCVRTSTPSLKEDLERLCASSTELAAHGEGDLKDAWASDRIVGLQPFGGDSLYRSPAELLRYFVASFASDLPDHVSPDVLDYRQKDFLARRGSSSAPTDPGELDLLAHRESSAGPPDAGERDFLARRESWPGPPATAARVGSPDAPSFLISGYRHFGDELEAAFGLWRGWRQALRDADHEPPTKEWTPRLEQPGSEAHLLHRVGRSWKSLSATRVFRSSPARMQDLHRAAQSLLAPFVSAAGEIGRRVGREIADDFARRLSRDEPGAESNTAVQPLLVDAFRWRGARLPPDELRKELEAAPRSLESRAAEGTDPERSALRSLPRLSLGEPLYVRRRHSFDPGESGPPPETPEPAASAAPSEDPFWGWSVTAREWIEGARSLLANAGTLSDRELRSAIRELVSAVHYEINASLGHALRGRVGVDLPAYFDRHQHSPPVENARVVSFHLEAGRKSSVHLNGLDSEVGALGLPSPWKSPGFGAISGLAHNIAFPDMTRLQGDDLGRLRAWRESLGFGAFSETELTSFFKQLAFLVPIRNLYAHERPVPRHWSQSHARQASEAVQCIAANPVMRHIVRLKAVESLVPFDAVFPDLGRMRERLGCAGGSS